MEIELVEVSGKLTKREYNLLTINGVISRLDKFQKRIELYIQEVTINEDTVSTEFQKIDFNTQGKITQTQLFIHCFC